jgi:hypothetical protein
VDFSSSIGVHVYYAVSYAVGFPAFTDTNKALLLTCIQDATEGAASIIVPECFHDSLVAKLQE